MCVNSNLSLIAKDHKKWIKIVKSLGAKTYAEDIVQDCYLKIHRLNYYNKIIEGDKVSVSYMYMILRSATNDYHNRNKKGLIEIRQPFENIDSLKITSFNEDKENAYLAICENIDKEINTWHWYDKEIFKIYRMHWRDKERLNKSLKEFNGKVSIRKIAKNTNISWVTLFNELKESKHKIRDLFQEDWEDYKNEDYHLITKQ